MASPRILAVIAGDGEGGAAVPVTVADLSGHLSDARRATPAEITAEIDRRPMEGAAGGLSPVAGSDRAILAIWAGAECDRSARLTISTGGTSLTIAPDRPAACAAPSSTYRAVVLTFDRPVDPASIELLFP